MGWRFRKSVKIAPGIRLNFGKKSNSISFGGKGHRVTFNTDGYMTTTNGIPGTGLYYQKRTKFKKTENQERRYTPIKARLGENELWALSDTDFLEYYHGYMTYAKSITKDSIVDDPDAVVNEVRLLNSVLESKAQARRKKKAKIKWMYCGFTFIFWGCFIVSLAGYLNPTYGVFTFVLAVFCLIKFFQYLFSGNS